VIVWGSAPTRHDPGLGIELAHSSRGGWRRVLARIRQVTPSGHPYERFGAGRPVAHWGGRYIWQVPGARKLLVGWGKLDGPGTARDAEIELLAHFRELHNGRMPFATLIG
jgi:hypothetical protein